MAMAGEACGVSKRSSSSCSSSSQPHKPASGHWGPKLQMGEMLSLLHKDREHLPSLIESMDEQAGETMKRSQLPVDLRRIEILNRVLELLTEQSVSKVGVLQSTIVSMFLDAYSPATPAFFYTPEEIDGGCAEGPSEPLNAAIELGVDDRLVVTIETFEAMVEQVPNFELARLLDAYTDYVQAMEMAWQVTTLEKQGDNPRIKTAAGIALSGEHAYIADSSQHMIFRVNMITDEITPFCGMRGKQGFHDGPREMARFNCPSGMDICDTVSTLYVCDTGNDAIRAISIPSGVVQTVSVTPTDGDTRLETPVGICIVRGEYEYEKEGSDDDEEDDENTVNSDNIPECEDEDEDDAIGSRHAPLLEGITEEEDEEMYVDSRLGSTFSQAWDANSLGQPPGKRTGGRPPNARYALANAEPSGMGGKQLVGKLHTLKSTTRRRISADNTAFSSRRTSGYMSTHTSRRTSGYMSSVSSLSSRRTSTHYTVTPGESAKDSLRECTEEEEEVGYSLAVTGDHCIYLVKPEKGDLMVLAGSPSEYGYKDAEKGADARFSSLKGIICIRNCLFVADHWNNAIRCINLKTRQVDTVIDFQPCGPIALTVSSSGSVYVLDSEYINVCNILKICSLQCSSKDTEGPLGTTMFQMIQEQIGRARSALSSARGSLDGTFLESMSRRGSARVGSRRGSVESDMSSKPVSRRTSAELVVNRRPSQDRDAAPAPAPSQRTKPQPARGLGDKIAGSISNLGPRGNQPTEGRAPNYLSLHNQNRPVSASSQASGTRTSGGSVLPVVPRALRSLVPGASLHPALVQMTLRSREAQSHHQSIQTALTGSQFHVSVVSSLPDDGFDEGPEFFSFLNPKHETPWKKIPMGTLQYVYQEATGYCANANTPLSLAYWDAADSDARGSFGMRNVQQLIVGGSEWPSVLKVLPPRKAAPQENGRFRAVAVDVDRVVMADSDSNQIFMVNHTKHTKDKIAGCGKAGYLDGPLDVCRMNKPSSIALDPTTHYIYVADSGNHRIRCIDLSTGFMRTVCGNGVKGNHDGNEVRLQSLDSPFDLHFMHPCHLLISCADNSIRRLDLKTLQLETVLIGS